MGFSEPQPYEIPWERWPDAQLFAEGRERQLTKAIWFHDGRRMTVVLGISSWWLEYWRYDDITAKWAFVACTVNMHQEPLLTRYPIDAWLWLTTGLGVLP